MSGIGMMPHWGLLVSLYIQWLPRQFPSEATIQSCQFTVTEILRFFWKIYITSWKTRINAFILGRANQLSDEHCRLFCCNRIHDDITPLEIPPYNLKRPSPVNNTFLVFTPLCAHLCTEGHCANMQDVGLAIIWYSVSVQGHMTCEENLEMEPPTWQIMVYLLNLPIHSFQDVKGEC